jgi:hypothetical protein
LPRVPAGGAERGGINQRGRRWCGQGCCWAAGVLGRCADLALRGRGRLAWPPPACCTHLLIRPRSHPQAQGGGLQVRVVQQVLASDCRSRCRSGRCRWRAAPHGIPPALPSPAAERLQLLPAPGQPRRPQPGRSLAVGGLAGAWGGCFGAGGRARLLQQVGCRAIPGAVQARQLRRLGRARPRLLPPPVQLGGQGGRGGERCRGQGPEQAPCPGDYEDVRALRHGGGSGGAQPPAAGPAAPPLAGPGRGGGGVTGRGRCTARAARATSPACGGVGGGGGGGGISPFLFLGGKGPPPPTPAPPPPPPRGRPRRPPRAGGGGGGGGGGAPPPPAIPPFWIVVRKGTHRSTQAAPARAPAPKGYTDIGSTVPSPGPEAKAHAVCGDPGSGPRLRRHGHVWERRVPQNKGRARELCRLRTCLRSFPLDRPRHLRSGLQMKSWTTLHAFKV